MRRPRRGSASAVELLRATGRARRRGDDPDELDAGVPTERRRLSTAERAAAHEDGAARATVGPLVGHARAPVASRTSASSSLLGPTGMQLVHRLEVVDVQLALEVVELVLERATEQARMPATLIFLPWRFWATTQTCSRRVT